MPDSPVADNIRITLVRQAKQQGEIAEVAGLTRQAMSRRMRGEVSFRADELARIAVHLSVTVDDLLNTPKAAS